MFKLIEAFITSNDLFLLRLVKMAIRVKILVALVVAVMLVDVVQGCAFNKRSSKGTSSNRVKREANLEPADCDYDYPYRTYDGSCNNLNDGTLGRAGSVFRRVLEPKYEDGKDIPTLTSHTNGTTLTNPRKISRIVHETTEQEYTTLSSFLFQWGQFLAHDITYTPWETVEGGCCNDIESLVVNGDLHPDIMVGGSCFPIIIDDEDYQWETDEERCMEFFRSAHIIDENGIRQQYSVASSFVDGSMVYGLDEDIALGLRSFEDGKLKATWRGGEEYLPELKGADDSICFLINPDDYCFAAGDDRANLFPGLSALQTVFLRYHNQIADRLASAHPLYDDETLYQEARRIVIAVIQKITYNEFLKYAAGVGNARTYGLSTSRQSPYAYNVSIDPTLINMFATAAFRFGHTIVPRNLTINGVLTDIGEMFMRPHYVFDGMLHLINALLDYPMEALDRWYAAGMVDNLFEAPDQPKSGYDIVARNLQRGRDHGLGTFNEYNVYFGLETLDNFTVFEEGTDVLYPQVYDNANDIEPYTGGLVGFLNNGPMFPDVIALQFQYLKYGDRFWYENDDSGISGGAKLFNGRQIDDINDNISFAKVLCLTVNGLETVQADVFISNEPDTDNPRISCDSLPDLDIEGLF